MGYVGSFVCRGSFQFSTGFLEAHIEDLAIGNSGTCIYLPYNMYKARHGRPPSQLPRQGQASSIESRQTNIRAFIKTHACHHGIVILWRRQ